MYNILTILCVHLQSSPILEHSVWRSFCLTFYCCQLYRLIFMVSTKIVFYVKCFEYVCICSIIKKKNTTMQKSLSPLLFNSPLHTKNHSTFFPLFLLISLVYCLFQHNFIFLLKTILPLLFSTFIFFRTPRVICLQLNMHIYIHTFTYICVLVCARVRAYIYVVVSFVLYIL